MGNVNNETTQNTVLNAIDKDNKSPNVPNLRFPYFTKQWTNISFSSLFDILPNNTLSRAELNYIEGEYKNIHYGDILIKLSAFTNIDSKDIPFVNSESIPKNSKDLLLKNGDVVFADTAEDYTVGKATEIGGIDNQKIIAGLHTIPCRPKYRFVQRYLGYYVNSPAYHNQLLPYIQGIKVSSISKSLIKHTTISYPNEEEQLKIINLLTFIDNKLLTQSKIIDGYKSLIKSISSYLFNDIKDTIKLSQLCKITTGKLDANQMVENGQYPFFTCGRETLQIDKYAFDCEAILIAGNGDIGHTKYYKGKFNAYQRTYILYNFNTNAKYIKYAIDLYLPQKVKEETQSSAMPYIKLGTLADLELPLTDTELQNKIVTILTIFERKLETEIDLLTKLKEQKKYLLSNMFI
ncbi:MAG: restriction endonuclease subunit S [Clostridia bacterium]|nr:restriction endonuclease subunit S [Clostridia bacterium]